MPIAIILVAPQMGENIGAAARAMKNFGLHDLRIVTPRDPWPNKQAQAMSVGAIDIIDNAKVFPSLIGAIDDLDYVYAAAATPRDINKTNITTKNLASQFPFDKKVGIMFGRESSGLSNDEIILADKIITINTNKAFTSLNLAHAVAVICHILFCAATQNTPLKRDEILATKGDIDHFCGDLIEKLEDKSFFRMPEKKAYLSKKIINLFNKIEDLSLNELQILRGIVKVLSK